MNAADAQRRADVIAALTENDVRAMPGDVLTRTVLAPLTRRQMCSMLRFLAGYSPRGFALAVRFMIDPEQLPDEETQP